MNLRELGIFHIVWGVSKGTRGNYHEICGVWVGGLHGPHGPHGGLHLLFIIHKNGKVQEHDLY